MEEGQREGGRDRDRVGEIEGGGGQQEGEKGREGSRAGGWERRRAGGIEGGRVGGRD